MPKTTYFVFLFVCILSFFLSKYPILLIIKCIAVILLLLLTVMFYVLLERSTLGSIQRRKGPNIVGSFGFMQSVADGIKLVSKEGILPEGSNPTIFISAPIVTFFVGLGGWVIIPFGEGSVISDISLGVLYLFALSSIGVYAIIMAGWSSNSKYAFLGALRSAAQMLSYEVAFGFGLLNVFISVGSLNLSNIVNIQREIIWLVYPLFPIFIMFFITLLAETSRHPFDLPEAESELVSGYNVEYSGITFSLFFLGEYLVIINMCAFCVILFLGGWDPFLNLSLLKLVGPFWFSIKIWFLGTVFILVRAAIPRYRYDQLIILGWKVFIPISIGFTVYNASIVCWSRGYYDILEIYSSWF